MLTIRARQTFKIPVYETHSPELENLVTDSVVVEGIWGRDSVWNIEFLPVGDFLRGALHPSHLQTWADNNTHACDKCRPPPHNPHFPFIRPTHWIKILSIVCSFALVTLLRCPIWRNSAPKSMCEPHAILMYNSFISGAVFHELFVFWSWYTTFADLWLNYSKYLNEYISMYGIWILLSNKWSSYSWIKWKSRMTKYKASEAKTNAKMWKKNVLGGKKIHFWDTFYFWCCSSLLRMSFFLFTSKPLKGKWMRIILYQNSISNRYKRSHLSYNNYSCTQNYLQRQKKNKKAHHTI